MTRVQIPAYTDRWMMGDRFGDLIKTVRRPGKVHVAHPVRAALLTNARPAREEGVEIATVKLDKSGKVVRVILADCTVL